MIYQLLAPIGAMVIEMGGEMFPQSIKKLPQEENFEWNDGGTRGKYS